MTAHGVDIIAMLLLYDIMLIMRFRLQNLVWIFTNPLLSLWRAQHSLLRVSLRVSVGRWQTWMNNACRSGGARLELRGARSLPARLPACLPSPQLGYSASVRRLATVPWPGEEFMVRARRRMMRGSCQSLIWFCSAVRATCYITGISEGTQRKHANKQK